LRQQRKWSFHRLRHAYRAGLPFTVLPRASTGQDRQARGLDGSIRSRAVQNHSISLDEIKDLFRRNFGPIFEGGKPYSGRLRLLRLTRLVLHLLRGLAIAWLIYRNF